MRPTKAEGVDLRIDLHMHSTASDGTYTPEELINAAVKRGLAAISITDHDTIDGTKAALKAGIPDGLDFLTGVEISATPPDMVENSGSIHILGYGFKVDDPKLNRVLEKLQAARRNRNPEIIRRLNELGIKIQLSEVEQIATSQVGRPHIARIMVKKKAAASISEAFDRYLGKGKPAYVDKFRVSCQQAVSLIANAGGIAVLAHPVLVKMKPPNQLENLVAYMVSLGMRGLEVLYPENSPEQTALYMDLAARYGLIATGGTDFHGSLKPTIKIGVGKGDLRVPYGYFQRLCQALA